MKTARRKLVATFVSAVALVADQLGQLLLVSRGQSKIIATGIGAATA
ncbi:MAG TPA: hypothetical protein VIJ84_06780 [Gaiellaceae bacterium]